MQALADFCILFLCILYLMGNPLVGLAFLAALDAWQSPSSACFGAARRPTPAGAVPAGGAELWMAVAATDRIRGGLPRHSGQFPLLAAGSGPAAEATRIGPQAAGTRQVWALRAAGLG